MKVGLGCRQHSLMGCAGQIALPRGYGQRDVCPSQTSDGVGLGFMSLRNMCPFSVAGTGDRFTSEGEQAGPLAQGCKDVTGVELREL